MSLFCRSASRLSGQIALPLAADPGDAFMDAARLYDPDVRAWRGRLVFRNGMLLADRDLAQRTSVKDRAALEPTAVDHLGR